jgi:hypothetical protein
VASAGGPASSAIDIKGDYDLVERIGTRKAWEVFLSTYKTGLYADLARAQLAKLDERDRKRSRTKVASAPKPSASRSKKKARAEPPPAATVPISEPIKPTPNATKLAALEPPAPQRPAPAPVSNEARAWERIKDSSDPKAYRDFIERYPDSVLSLTAQKHLSALEEAAREREAAKKREQERKREQEKKVAKAVASAPAVAAPAQPTPDPADLACERDEQRLAVLKGVRNRDAARADLEHLQKTLSCEKLRPAVVAALGSLPEAKPAEPVPPEVNTPEQVRTAQLEMDRIGCFDGAADGILGPVTRAAVDRYLSVRGRPKGDNDVTDDLIADLKKEKARVCPLRCGAGEVVKGERCIAEKQKKPERAAHRDRRHGDDAKRKRFTRSKPARSRPRQEAVNSRPQRHSGRTVIGVGF